MSRPLLIVSQGGLPGGLAGKSDRPGCRLHTQRRTSVRVIETSAKGQSRHRVLTLATWIHRGWTTSFAGNLSCSASQGRGIGRLLGNGTLPPIGRSAVATDACKLAALFRISSAARWKAATAFSSSFVGRPILIGTAVSRTLELDAVGGARWSASTGDGGAIKAIR
jgi:hypothetical protein